MRRITAYITKKLMVNFLVITMTLLAIVWLSQSLKLVDLLVNRGLPFSLFVKMTLLTLPWMISIILPITYFIAVTQTYYRMIIDSEINVMRAVGLSPLVLAKPAFLLGGILCIFGYTITLHIMPNSYKVFENLRYIIKYDYSSVLLQEGAFTELLDNVTVYVRERSRDGRLRGVLIHDSRIPNQPVTIVAEEGALVRTDNGPRVVMVAGNRQEISQETKQISLLHFDRYSFDILNPSSQGDGRLGRKLPELSLQELFYPENHSYLHPSRYGVYRAQGHQRLLLPLYLLVFPALSLAILFKGEYSRQGRAQRIGVAVVAFVIVQGLAMSLENIAASQPIFILFMYLNVGLPLLLSLIWLNFPKLGQKWLSVGALKQSRR